MYRLLALLPILLLFLALFRSLSLSRIRYRMWRLRRRLSLFLCLFLAHLRLFLRERRMGQLRQTLMVPFLLFNSRSRYRLLLMLTPPSLVSRR